MARLKGPRNTTPKEQFRTCLAREKTRKKSKKKVHMSIGRPKDKENLEATKEKNLLLNLLASPREKLSPKAKEIHQPPRPPEVRPLI